MSGSDKHACKLCGNETYEIFAYPSGIPEVVPFMAYMKKSSWEGKWLHINLRLCPKCGHVQGEAFENDF